MNINKDKRNIIFTLVVKVIGVLLSFLNTIFINRYLGPSLRGDYTVIIQSANFIQLFLNLGIGFSYASDKNEESEKKVISLLIWQFIIYLIFFVPFSFLFDLSARLILIVAITEITCTQLMFVSMVSNIRLRNVIDLLNSVFYTTILFVTFLLDIDNKIIIISLIVCAKYLIESVIVFIVFHYYKSINLFDKSLFGAFVKSLRIGLPTMLISLLLACNYNLDVLIMKWMNVDSEKIGYYGVAVTLANMAWLVPDTFKDVLFNKNKDKIAKRFLSYSFVFNFTFTIILLIGFYFLGKWFLTTFYGSDYLESYSYCLILFVGTIPMSVFKVLHPIMISHNHQISVCIVLIISVIVNVIGNIIVIPLFAIYGVAWASVISYGVCSIGLMLMFIRRKNEYVVY